VANRDIVAIGTSAGGVEAVRSIGAQLPADLPAAVLVVIHISGQFRSVFDQVLSRTGPLPASFATEGESIKHGRIYIAPAECHLLCDGQRLTLGTGPRENGTRPAIDPLFRSLALCCGPRTIGIVLTGTLGDGAAGLQTLGACGGLTVVQDPSDAVFSEMPATAMNRIRPDHVSRLADLPSLIEQLVRQPAGKEVPVPDFLKYEVEIAASGRANMKATDHAKATDRIKAMDQAGRRSVLTCPDCSGVLWEIEDGDIIRYRCHVGHAYTAEAMSLATDDGLRHALGSALRALDERGALAQRMQSDASGRGRKQVAGDWARKAKEFEAEADVIRNAVKKMDGIASRSMHVG